MSCNGDLMQWQKDSFLVSSDRALLDFEVIYQFIANSYWAKNIPRQTLQKGIDNALCFGLYDSDKQVGFARVISDCATFGYLADVFVLPSHQGKGLGKWLISCIMAHPDLQGLRRFMLATADAHGLYRQFGFDAVNMPERLMQVHKPDIYASQARQKPDIT